MSEPKKGRTLAIPMTFSCYPHERDALQRILRAKNLKSVFDTVRLLAEDSRHCGVKAEDFCSPKKKS
jgi:hypothetical protein